MTAFEEAKLAAMTNLQQRNGIGRLKEYSLHATLKYWMQPDEQFHEVKRLGYVVDCVVNPSSDEPCEELIEIQTGNFSKMGPKLTALLTEYPVTIVYPIQHRRRICWVDPDTGEMSKPRLSPKIGRFIDALTELRWIEEPLSHFRLEVLLVQVDVMEYRLQNGWSKDGKKGSQRVERLPLTLGEQRRLTCPADYAALLEQEILPDQTLPSPFTAKQFGAAFGLKDRKIYQVLHLLESLGILEQAGTAGRARLYQKQILQLQKIHPHNK